MAFEKYPSSDKAKFGKDDDSSPESISQRFDELEFEQSLIVGMDEVNIASLRTIASRKNKEGAKRFRIVLHQEYGKVEIARLK